MLYGTPSCVFRLHFDVKEQNYSTAGLFLRVCVHTETVLYLLMEESKCLRTE